MAGAPAIRQNVGVLGRPQLASLLLLVGACADIGTSFSDASSSGDTPMAASDTASVDSTTPDVAVVEDVMPSVDTEPPDTEPPAPDVPDAGPDIQDPPLDMGGEPDLGPPPTDDGMPQPDDGLPPVENCTPCGTADDCAPGEPCVPYGNVGSFCGELCEDFICTPASEGVQTACKKVSEIGVCTGTRGCVDGELTACSALLPGPEVCDGLDNDCDGQTDEGFPDQDGDGQADCFDGDDDGDGGGDVPTTLPIWQGPSLVLFPSTWAK